MQQNQILGPETKRLEWPKDWEKINGGSSYRIATGTEINDNRIRYINSVVIVKDVSDERLAIYDDGFIFFARSGRVMLEPLPAEEPKDDPGISVGEFNSFIARIVEHGLTMNIESLGKYTGATMVFVPELAIRQEAKALLDQHLQGATHE